MARRGSAASTRAVPVGAGERDRYVTIQRLTDASGTTGFPTDDWTTLPALSLFAQKAPLGGMERFVNSQVTSPYDTRWEIEYRPDMDPDLIDVPKTRRLTYLGRTYDIVDATVIGRNDGIELLTLARQG